MVSAAEASLYIGLMSGTSADGIDAALVWIHGQGDAASIRLLHALTHPWPAALRAQLLAIGQGGEPASLDAFGRLDAEVGACFAEAAQALLQASGTDPSRIAAIGSHGQTVRHRPYAQPAFTLQIGDPSRIAERTGIATVADFRRRDVAAGGHGAPLLPALHHALLHASDEDRAVLNLGGIANVTLLPATGPVRGFDTGPANALLDAWGELHTGQRYDAEGAFAASGNVDTDLLQRLLGDPWFAAPPPKSTGREHFHLDWLHARLRGTEPAADVQATLLQLTARTVAEALQATQPGTRRVLVCGGGVHNPVLLQALQSALPAARVESTAAHGLDPDHVEAMGFAWLARQTLLGLPGNLPAVTGAAGPRVLGAIYPG